MELFTSCWWRQAGSSEIWELITVQRGLFRLPDVKHPAHVFNIYYYRRAYSQMCIHLLRLGLTSGHRQECFWCLHVQSESSIEKIGPSVYWDVKYMFLLNPLTLNIPCSIMPSILNIYISYKDNRMQHYMIYYAGDHQNEQSWSADFSCRIIRNTFYT